MNKPVGYDNAEAMTYGDYEKLEPGGYVCKIVGAEICSSRSGNEMLKLDIDIAKGEHADYYQRRYENSMKYNATGAKWQGCYYQLTQDKKQDDRNVSRLKGLLITIEKNNPGFKWNWNELDLVGKLFGGVFGEEEYRNYNKQVRTSTKLVYIQDIEGIENAKIPAKKGLEGTKLAKSMGTEIPDEEIPF